MLILGNWSKPSERSAVIEWVNRVNKRLLPFVSSDYGAVALGEVDHLGGEGKPGRRLYDDQAWEKLRKVKTKYDPQNIFHKNYNIPPL
jgi:FAD/FMN-containing dehydrogenase